MISGKSGRIELYLRHKLEVYEKSLNRKRKNMAQEKVLRPRSCELQTEVDSNRQNERQIRELEQEYSQYEQEIQNLNREIERLENASEEEIAELKSEISSLKNKLYQTKKDVRDKEKYISSLEARLVESEEQVKKLRCQIKTISSWKNSPERGNSLNLYNSDDNMATIIELANAIDSFVDNQSTTRAIIADQVKRATRQIRRKETTLQQNLILNMAGIPHPYFDCDDSIPDFLAQLRLDLQNRGIDPNDNVGDPPTGRDNAIGHLRTCMRGRTLKWFDNEITTKQNWELTNLLDNTGQANLVAVNGRTALQIGANALNEAVGQPGNAIVKLRAVEDAWNEDWRIAGGRPTNDPVNAPNANAGNTVVVAGIRFGQAVWWLKTHFPTIEEELQDLTPEELRRKFLDALPLPWLEKAEDIELRQITKHKRDRISDPLISNRASWQIYKSSPVSTSQQQGISLEDMQKAIQNALA
ncbi:hypothetical protein GLOIN_2v1778046 [Rhizophagus clarus]|uniref:Uncharacterized protein n=1 Tax=Rhizophagus clarus TaxID=94130 RepID=A0A8H3QQW4_9GLOM|nr:hypothetical protein GLOIN_2v1778046 [Rhizophagus clarus]